jgi:cellobiose transport system permease protein
VVAASTTAPAAGDLLTMAAPVHPNPAARLHPALQPDRPSAVRRLLWRADGRISPYIYIAPFFLLFIGFGLFPILYTGYVSLTNRELLRPGVETYTGLANYRELVGDDYFWNAVKNTFLMMVMGVLLPNVTSIVAVALVFAQIFSRDFGIVNWVLGRFGIDSITWQSGDWTSRSAIAVMVIWRWTGYNALIYLGAMQAIPKELFEAAALDRAGTWRQLWHITLPALRPTIAFTALVSLIGQTQLFTEPLLFDTSPGSVSGGSARQFQTMALFMYEEGFRLGHLGYGAAVAWLMILMTFVLAAIGYAITRRAVGTGGAAT